MSQFKGIKITVELHEKDGGVHIVLAMAGVAEKKTALLAEAIIDHLSENTIKISEKMGGTCKQLYSEKKQQEIPKG